MNNPSEFIGNKVVLSVLVDLLHIVHITKINCAWDVIIGENKYQVEIMLSC